jgi:hypothetical protein
VTYKDNLAINKKKSDVNPEAMMANPDKGDLSCTAANSMRFAISKALAEEPYSISMYL